MSRTITIRNVPDHVADELSSRARDGGRSLQAFLLGLLCREASTPDIQAVLHSVREQARVDGISLDNTELLALRDADERLR